jgi:hypothetical protein
MKTDFLEHVLAIKIRYIQQNLYIYIFQEINTSFLNLSGVVKHVVHILLVFDPHRNTLMKIKILIITRLKLLFSYPTG